MEGGETFDASLLGTAEEVVEERVSDDDVILVKGAKSSRAVSEYLFHCYVFYIGLLITLAFFIVILFPTGFLFLVVTRVDDCPSN